MVASKWSKFSCAQAIAKILYGLVEVFPVAKILNVPTRSLPVYKYIML